jgi:phosphate transport system permease protein
MNTKIRLLKDKLASKSMLGLTVLSVLLAIIIGLGLYIRSAPLLSNQPLSELLGGSEWMPFKGKFGFYPFIIGTLYVTVIAIIIALPLCLLSAIYISEYAPVRLRKIIVPFVDLLAGIPPVVFGVWGVLFVVPIIADKISPYFVEFSTGYCILSGGIVLAIMIFPLIINVLLEVFATVPQGIRDASLSLGATQWQTSKFVLLKKALPGIIAASVLAISRAFGETIAVLMVCGNVPQIPTSVFEAGYPLPALIANNYGEMLSIPLYDSALLFAALILFVIIFIFNAISRIILARLEKNLA